MTASSQVFKILCRRNNLGESMFSMYIFLVFYVSCIHSFSSGFQDVMDYDEVYKRLQELNNLLKQIVRNKNLQNRRGTPVSANAARYWVANDMAAMLKPRRQFKGVCIKQILICTKHLKSDNYY